MASKNSINANRPTEVAAGGTGAATLTANSLLLGNGASAVSALGAATNGQLPIGNTGNAPSLTAITAGTNISVTNGAGSITIANTATATGSLILIQSQDASGSSTINFTTGISSTYKTYYFAISNILPGTAADTLNLLVSTDGGMNWLATNYVSGINYLIFNSGTGTLTNVNTTTSVRLTGALSTSAPTSSVSLWCNNVTSGNRIEFTGQTTFKLNGSNTHLGMIQSVGSSSAVNVNAFQFLMSTGTISTGTFTLYGLKES